MVDYVGTRWRSRHNAIVVTVVDTERNREGNWRFLVTRDGGGHPHRLSVDTLLSGYRQVS